MFLQILQQATNPSLSVRKARGRFMCTTSECGLWLLRTKERQGKKIEKKETNTLHVARSRLPDSHWGPQKLYTSLKVLEVNDLILKGMVQFSFQMSLLQTIHSLQFSPSSSSNEKRIFYGNF